MYDIHASFNAYTSTVHHSVSTDIYPSLVYVQYAMCVWLCGLHTRMRHGGSAPSAPRRRCPTRVGWVTAVVVPWSIACYMRGAHQHITGNDRSTCTRRGAYIYICVWYVCNDARWLTHCIADIDCFVIARRLVLPAIAKEVVDVVHRPPPLPHLRHFSGLAWAVCMDMCVVDECSEALDGMHVYCVVCNATHVRHPIMLVYACAVGGRIASQLWWKQMRALCQSSRYWRGWSGNRYLGCAHMVTYMYGHICITQTIESADYAAHPGTEPVAVCQSHPGGSG